MSSSIEGDDNKPPNCLGALWTMFGGGVDKTIVLVDAEMKCKRVSFNYERQTFKHKKAKFNQWAS